MNTIIYELLEARLLADRGTLASTAISCPLPTVIIPEQAVIIRTASSSYQVGKGQFIMLLHDEEPMRIAPAEEDDFSPIYSISFKSYRLIKRETDSLTHETSLEHLLFARTARARRETAWELENKVIQDQIEGIKSTGERSFEAMLGLNPDLIVTWTSEKNIIEQYEKIAPTISIPYGHFNDIHDTLRFFGKALGKDAEAEQWLTDFDKTVTESRAQLAGIVKPEDTFALMGVFVVDKGFYIYGDGGYRGGEAIYRHLQLTPPEKQKQEMIGKEQYKQISYEVVGDYAGEYIFLDQGDMLSEVWGKNDGIWKTLDAVKNNRVFQLDPNLFWGNDPISLKLQIQEVVKMLSERAKQS